MARAATTTLLATCAVLGLLSVALATSEAGAKAGTDLAVRVQQLVLTAVNFVVPPACLDKFLAANFTDAACIKTTISKLIGVAIIAGACFVKLPQIITFLRAKSVAGVSRESTYLDLLGYVLTCVYYVRSGSPFTAYGETVVILVQSVVIVFLLWTFNFPGMLHVLLVSAAAVGVTYQLLVLDAHMLMYMQLAATALFMFSRTWQILVNVRQGGTGTLSPITLFMNFAGSAARVFTSAVEVKRVEVFVSTALTASLNFLLLAQYFYYKRSAPRSDAAPSTKSAPSAAAGAKGAATPQGKATGVSTTPNKTTVTKRK